MMDSMEIERTKKRGEMLVYLDDGNYGSFKKQFKKALLNDRLWEMNTAGNDGKPLPYKVKDVLPILVYGQFSSLLSYDELVSKNPDEIPMELLHQLRIDVKIMRYNLEFFRDVLGKESKILIQVLKDLQDNLGDMHDASVAIELLQGYEETGRWGVKEADAGKLDGAIAANKTIEALVISRHEEIAELKAAFPEKWGAIRDPEFGAGLASSIAGLYRQN
jgi:CHAD domain-containing protein